MASLCTTSAHAQSYTLVDLGVFNTAPYTGGLSSEAWGISDNGYITGWSQFKITGPYPGSFDYRPTGFLWKPNVANGSTGTMINCKALGPTQGAGYHDGYTSSGVDVNNSGVVAGINWTGLVGPSQGQIGVSNSSATIWVPNAAKTDGTLYDLRTFTRTLNGSTNSGVFSFPVKITNSGRTYGTSGCPQIDPISGLVRNDYGMGFNYIRSATIANLDYSTDAMGLYGSDLSNYVYGANEFNKATGTNGSSVLLYSNGAIVNLSSFSGTSSKGLAINDAGIITGNRNVGNGNYNAFVWTPTTPNGSVGTSVDIVSDASPVLRSGVVPIAISNTSPAIVVGYVWTTLIDGTNYSEYAFRWTPTTGRVSLNTFAGWSINRANDINATGQIVGIATNSLGNHRAILLQP